MEQLRILNLEQRSGNTGTYQIVTFQDPNTGQQIKASNWQSPIDQSLVGYIVQAELRKKGQWTNVVSVTVAPQEPVPSAPPAPPASQPTYQAPPPPQPQAPQPQGPQPQAPQPQAPQTQMPQPKMPQEPVYNVSKRDVIMAKMSALRSAAEEVAGMIPIMAAGKNPPSNEKIKELTVAYANDYLAYILDQGDE